MPDSLAGVAIVSPDDFFAQLLEEGLGVDIAATISRMSARLKNPHRSPSEIINGLEQIGLTKTARHLRNH